MAKKRKGATNKPAKTTNHAADEAANLPTIDDLAEMAEETEDVYIDEPARDIVNDPPGRLTREEQQAAFNEIFTDEQRREMAERLKNSMAALFDNGAFEKMKESFSKTANALFSAEIRDALKKFYDALKQYEDITELEPYIEKELEKPEYNGATLKDLLSEYSLADLLALPKDSTLYKVIEAAREARAEREALIQAQQASRDNRRLSRLAAEEQGAVMTLDNFAFFSDKPLWDAFAPGRICKMGTLPKEYIDTETGLITKVNFDDGEIENLNPTEISLKAMTLLNSIFPNTVENARDEFVENGEISFYVKGVLDNITDDPRTLLDDQISMSLDNPLSRKTAGVLYLENLFEPLQGFIGTTPNGSRYTIFNYVGYDFDSDTMTVQLPYLFQLWRHTQAEYFDAQQRKQAAIAANKRPKKADLTPLKINEFFKNRAYSVDDVILEIAVYITNVLLSAGNVGKQKKTTIEYRTIINNCPRFKNKLEEIENDPDLKNPHSRYNAELKKIAKAFDLIHDPDKSDVLKHYEFIDIKPGKISKGGKFIFEAPTKRKLDGKLTIVWKRKPDDDLI